ncbi:MAG: hypothetical protein D6808_04095, partial [Candidatus Dadabacteria bacterium]
KVRDFFLQLFSKMDRTSPAYKAIATISSPEWYSRARQAGRMRCYTPPLPQSVLKKLQKEIQAAFTWVEACKRRDTSQ